MTITRAGTAVAAVFVGVLSPAFGLEVLRTDTLSLEAHGRGQMIGVGEVVPDAVRDHARLYLFLKQARLGFAGRYEDIKFETLFAFGGENPNGSNTDLGMLDFVADVPVRPLGEDGVLKVGQFRVPFGREGLTDAGMNFAERSIANMASYQGRDYGLALQKRRGTLFATLGVFSGGGRDIPQRYLPERLGWPETVLRLGYNDGVDADVYHVAGSDPGLERTAKAAYLSGLYMQDTLIGHSTVMNVRTIDKNLLVNANYNQYINAGPDRKAGTPSTLQRGNIWFVGMDAVLRRPLGAGRGLEGEAEAAWGGYQNRYGGLHIASGRLQGGYRRGEYTWGLRYAALLMDRDANFLSGGKYFSPGVGSAIHEVTPSLTWRVRGERMKLVADAPVYFNMPVYTDKAVGAYVMAEQPDQVGVLATAGNSVSRRTVPEARLVFQFEF